MVEKNSCHCWRRKPLLGGLGTSSPREILKIYAPNEAIWGCSISFHKLFFFSPLKIQKVFETSWLDKDIRNGELLIILLYTFVFSSSWQNTRRCEIYSFSIEQKTTLWKVFSVWKVSGFSMHTSNCSRHEPRECSKSFAVTFECRFHKGTNKPTAVLKFLAYIYSCSLYTCNIFARSFLVLCQTMVSTGQVSLGSWISRI